MKLNNVHLTSNKYLDNISTMFKTFYNDEQLADVTLWCKDGSLKAHKLILASTSPYFHQIFVENNHKHPILIMHGITYQNLQNLIELIYKGTVNVLPESVNTISQLAKDLEINGIIQDEENDLISSHGRDTRFRGLKRVAVDYKDDEKIQNNKKICDASTTTVTTDRTDTGQDVCETEEKYQIPQQSTTKIDESPKLSAWAKKQRKFKCELCPSSFKRASHLTRHQLVHTGERPYACNQCDKAFSRHDKLKHHIRKTHELFPELIGNTTYPTQLHQTLEIETKQPMTFEIVQHVTSETTETPSSAASNNLPKRGRGRPRKYPISSKPLIKRGRGRPRLNPVHRENNGENYDITNLPYGDLEYLTMPLQQPCNSDERSMEADSVIIEPYVEIKTEPNEKEEQINAASSSSEVPAKNPTEKLIQPVLCSFENKIAKIGECTISVANH